MKSALKLAVGALLLILTLQASPLGLDLQATEILGSKDQFRIQLRPQGGQGPFAIFYTRKPGDWLPTERYLFAPKATSNIYNQVLISVVIRDQSKNEYKLSLIFMINGQHMFMDSTVYAYTVELTLPSLSMPAPTFKSQLERIIKGILRDSKSLQDPLLSFDDVFQGVLMFKDVKEALDTMNILAIIKAISMIPSTELNCVQQLAYVSQVSTMAYQSIQDKLAAQQESEQGFMNKYRPTSTNTSAPVDNTGTTQLQNKTQQLIAQMQSQVNKQKTDYFIKLQQLKQAYMQYNSISTVVDKNQKEVTANQIKIDNNMKEIDSNYAKIYEIGFKIPKLAEQADKDTLAQMKDQLTKNNSILTAAIEGLRKAVKDQTEAITKMAEQQDKRKLLTKSLQSQIISLQQRISQKYIQLLHLYQPLDNADSPFLLFMQGGYYLNLRNTAELDALFTAKRDIAILYDIISYIDGVLNQMYFLCYGVKNVRAAQAALSVYEIPYGDFMAYARNFYQNNTHNRLIFANTSLPASKIQLQRINILDSIWTKKFGNAIYQPTSSDPKSPPALISCQAPVDLEGFTGIITALQGNVIQARMARGDLYYVLLGACSRVELAGQGTPQVGNMIFWRGKQVTKDIYDSYYTLIL